MRPELGGQTLEESVGLIVVGMHRSGTSALTGALHASGAYAGDSGDLTGSSIENQKGFFERRDIRQISDALLHAAGADWWKISDFEIGHIEQSQLEVQRNAFARVVENLSQAKTWIIKEPRLCLLLPVLIDLIPNPICIFIYRNPIEVAKSLRTRNQISLQQGIALWEKYNWSAIEATRARSRVYVSYQDLIADPHATLDGVVNKLAELGVKGLSRPVDSSNFIDRSLRRSIVQSEEMEILTAEQWDLWNLLEKKAGFDDEYLHKTTPGQRSVLKDLEHQFEKHNKIRNGVELTIRSRKVYQIARFLDHLVFNLVSRVRK